MSLTNGTGRDLRFRLGFDIRIIQFQPLSRLESEATGGLEGSGRWRLTGDDGGTLVRMRSRPR